MVNKHDKYLIDKAIRIDSRYWLIEKKGQKYLVDYSNPKNIKSYIPFVGDKLINKWKIYKLEDTNLTLKNGLHITTTSYTTKLIRYYDYLCIFYILMILLLPKKINPVFITYDSKIKENWKYILFAMLLVLGIIIIYFILKEKNISIDESKVMCLERVDDDYSYTYKKEKGFRRLVMYTITRIPASLLAFIIMIIAIPSLFLIGFSSSSYIQLVMFTLIPFYVLILYRFIIFIPLNGKSKYKILEVDRGV